MAKEQTTADVEVQATFVVKFERGGEPNTPTQIEAEVEKRVRAALEPLTDELGLTFSIGPHEGLKVMEEVWERNGEEFVVNREIVVK